MSDQYTRIRYGGSPLESDAPVTGLLFGTRRTGSAGATKNAAGAEDNVLEVRDAEDIPLDLSESAQLQEELHRAVFPAHRVVGWYRVAESDDVIESDVTFTDALARHYRHNNISTSSPFVFALLVIDGGMSSAVGGGDKDAEDEPLPLTVYRQADGGVLHSVPDWALETLDSERIAVERVIREQPPPAHHAGGDDPDSAAAGDAMTSLSLDGPRFVQHTHTLDHSLSAIHRRLDVLRTFLQDTLDEKIPWNASLIRQVNEVMLQAGAIHRPTCASADSDPTSNVGGSEMMVPIAYLLKTVDAVRSYSDKFRAAHDSSATASSGAGPLSSVARSRDRDYSKRL
jgi:hypothetical protein